MRAQQQRIQRGEQCHFLVRKNPHYPRRRQLLPELSDITEHHHHVRSCHLVDCQQCTDNFIRQQQCSDNSESGTDLIDSLAVNHHNDLKETTSTTTTSTAQQTCKMCQNSFRSCEFCNKNVIKKLSTRQVVSRLPVTTYNPVYNIREIRSVCQSFTPISVDRKLLDLESSNKTIPVFNSNNNNNNSSSNLNSNSSNPSIVQEAVNNIPAKGFGSYVYI